MMNKETFSGASVERWITYVRKNEPTATSDRQIVTEHEERTNETKRTDI